VTRKSLGHALTEHRLSLDDQQTAKLMQAYDNLSAFQDVNPALKRLESNSDVECVVFSNGTKSMVSSSVNDSKDLNSTVFKDLVTVDFVRAFKPAPEVYQFLAQKTQHVGLEDQIWLVSGNPFDIVGARACGMQAAWVDRAGNGWQDRLGQDPTVIVRSLEEVADVVEKHAAKK
jgi:2-haloacid dehalogenase